MISIEWLIKQFELDYNGENDLYYHEFIEQAKEMHKKEIIDAYEKGEFDCGCNGTGEDYYNKTFKKD